MLYQVIQLRYLNEYYIVHIFSLSGSDILSTIEPMFFFQNGITFVHCRSKVLHDSTECTIQLGTDSSYKTVITTVSTLVNTPLYLPQIQPNTNYYFLASVPVNLTLIIQINGSFLLKGKAPAGIHAQILILPQQPFNVSFTSQENKLNERFVKKFVFLDCTCWPSSSPPSAEERKLLMLAFILDDQHNQVLQVML